MKTSVYILKIDLGQDRTSRKNLAYTVHVRIVQTSPEEQFVIIVYIHNNIVKQEESFEAMLKMIFFLKRFVKDEVINFGCMSV